MFGRNKKNKEEEDNKTKITEEGGVAANIDVDTEAKDADIEKNPNKEVLVRSKMLLDVKVIVIYQKIKPQQGPLRDQFNTYHFDKEGESIMFERDAILFWKKRKSIEGMEDDISVLTISDEGEDGVEYTFEEVKDLYEIKEVDLSSSQPRG